MQFPKVPVWNERKKQSVQQGTYLVDRAVQPCEPVPGHGTRPLVRLVRAGEYSAVRNCCFPQYRPREKCVHRDDTDCNSGLSGCAPENSHGGERHYAGLERSVAFELPRKHQRRSNLPRCIATLCSLEPWLYRCCHFVAGAPRKPFDTTPYRAFCVMPPFVGRRAHDKQTQNSHWSYFRQQARRT